MTLRCEILTLKTSHSFFRSFRFLRKYEAFSATEQNQTYHNSFFFFRLHEIYKLVFEKIIVAKNFFLTYNRQEYRVVALREATVWMFLRELMVGENQQAEVPFHFLSIDESQRLVSFNVPTRGCYRFSYLRQGRLMYLDMFI